MKASGTHVTCHHYTKVHLRTQPCGVQVLLLVVLVAAEEDEEVNRGDSVLWTGV